MFPDFSLNGKVAVVTGGSKGIGRCASLSLSHAGADVIIVARNKEGAKQVQTEIESMGGRALAYSCDISNIEQSKAMIDHIAQEFGRVDILVNNAGVTVPQYAVDVTPDAWDRVFALDLRGLFFCCQAVGKQMIAKKIKGKIINMSSTFSQVAYPKRSSYGAAKGGLVQLTKVLALEWASFGINVNAISPTAIRTPMTEAILRDPEIYRDLLSRIPMGRIGEPEDIAGAIVFLAGSASDFITGQNIFVDGGWTIQ